MPGRGFPTRLRGAIGLLLAALLGPAGATTPEAREQPLPRRWVYVSTNLLVPENVSATSGVPNVTGVMYTTWQNRYDDIEAFEGRGL